MSKKIELKIAMSKVAKEEPEIFGEVMAELLENNYPGLKDILHDIRSIENGLITWSGKVYEGKLVEISRTTVTERRTYYD